MEASQDRVADIPPNEARLRVAIVSTPRSGNTWLWHLLTAVYDAPGLTAHHPADVPWDNLPADFVLQIHWQRSEPFLAMLEKHGFQVVVMARHPLDVLISILHHVPHDPNTDLWLAGEGGDERTILGVMPRSTAFREYVTGPRAAALLAVGRDWWSAPGCHQARYEELSQDPQGELERLVKALGITPRKTCAEAVESSTIPRLRARWQTNHYFWLGKTGLWRSLLPASDAEPLEQAVQPNLSLYGYSFDPDPELSGLQADLRWTELFWPAVVEDLQSLRPVKHERNTLRSHLEASEQTVHRLAGELAARHLDFDQALRELHEVRQRSHTQQAEAQRQLAELQWQLDAARRELDQVGPIGPMTIALVRTIRHFSVQYPWAAALVKKAISWAG